MGISSEYRDFHSVEGYKEFFQEVQASGVNAVDMYVEPLDGGQSILQPTYVPNPEHDHNLLDLVMTQPQYAGRFMIKPVLNLQEYRDNTDEHGYRVAVQKELVAKYRRLMTKENKYFPLLAMDAERKLWLSGRHRAEAGKLAFGAFFALVCDDLTPTEALYITDITNTWHAQSWDPDEAALLAYGHMLVDNLSEKQALVNQGLDAKGHEYILGAMLYKHHKQGPQDRRLLESHKGGQGGGHPRRIKTIGDRVKVFGEEAIEVFPIERWLYLNEDEARKALGLIRSRTNSTLRGDYYSQLFMKSDFDMAEWTLKGNPEARWTQFIALIQVMRQVNLDKTSNASGPTDDRIFMNYCYKLDAISDAGLASMKAVLTPTEREVATKVVNRLHRTFS